MSAHTDTTVIADSVECSLCCDEVKSSQVVVDFCADYIDHGTVCRACMTYYITDKINSSFLGACPSMHCPCVHVGGVRKFLKFPNWKHVVGTSIYSKSVGELKQMEILANIQFKQHVPYGCTVL